MIEKTISWKLIERLLKEHEKTSSGLFVYLEVAKGRFGNWKTRGAPLNQADAIAKYIGVSVTDLLGVESALADKYSGQSDEMEKFAKLAAIYSRLQPGERDDVLIYAERLHAELIKSTESVSNDIARLNKP